MIKYLDKPKGVYFIRVKNNKDLPRHWTVLKELKIQLSDGDIITIPENYIFDGASVPKKFMVVISSNRQGRNG